MNKVSCIILSSSEIPELVIEGGARTRRYGRLEGAKLSLSVVSMDPGQGHTWHRHVDSDEITIIWNGSGTFAYRVDGKTKEVEVKEGDIMYIPAGAEHQFINTGTVTTIAVAAASPPIE